MPIFARTDRILDKQLYRSTADVSPESSAFGWESVRWEVKGSRRATAASCLRPGAIEASYRLLGGLL